MSAVALMDAMLRKGATSMQRYIVLLGAFVMMFAGTAAIPFQNPSRPHPLDPLTVAAAFTSQVMENGRARVLSIQIRPGETVPFHKVMRSVLISMESGKVRFRQPDGTLQEVTFPSTQASGLPISKSSVLWDDPATYSIENCGDTTIRLIRIELK